MSYDPIARYLDHAVLKPELTQEEAEAQIRIGVAHNVRTVCVRPADIPLARGLCRGTDVELCCVLDFPHGCNLSALKTIEAHNYVSLGVREIDMVVNYGMIRSGLWNAVRDDIRAVSSVTRRAGVVLKVILETSALTVPQIEKATLFAIEAEAEFVKTSTGFGANGATDEAVEAMLRAADGRIGVKASGGIRDRAAAEHFLALGCTRLGVGAASTPLICTQPST